MDIRTLFTHKKTVDNYTYSISLSVWFFVKFVFFSELLKWMDQLSNTLTIQQSAAD